MEIVELDGNLPLWAVANEKRHWKAADIELVRRDASAIGRLANGDGPRQADLAGGSVADLRLEQARKTLVGMKICGISTFRLADDDYPARLASIPDPPLVLYTVGTVSVYDRCIGVSGTREASDWGRRTAFELGAALAGRGWLVTSGMARGIDTEAHRGALSVPSGRTVAVSALPLDRVYPPENQELALRIIRRGAVVTEHALEKNPGAVSFLRRNRIISGLSLALFIVETSGKGGTLKQARDALLQKRPLYIMEPPATEERSVNGFDELVRLGAEPCPDVETAVASAGKHWPRQ